MNLEQFKKQRNELVAKLAVLAMQINERGKYMADCEITGHVNWVNCAIKYEGVELFSSILHPFPAKDKKMYLGHEGRYQEGEQLYKAIIKDLQNTHKQFSKYLGK